MTFKLSPSRLNLFRECPRCFWLRVRKKKERPNRPFPSLPSGMDRKLKDYFDRYREREELPPELEDRCPDLQLLGDTGLLERARDWRREPVWNDPETGASLRGGVDDLLETPADSLVVLDYKTRGYPPSGDSGVPAYYERQVNLYSLILEETNYRTAGYGLVLYLYPGRVLEGGKFAFKSELRKVPVDLEKARGLVREAVETLEGDMPRHSPGCDYSDWEPVLQGS